MKLAKKILGPLILLSLAAIGFIGSTMIPPGIAHADPSVVTVAPVTPWGPAEWFGLGLAALGGLKVIVDAALAFFRFLAPQTKTTVDDDIRDDLQLAHDKLDALSALVRGMPKPVSTQIPVVASAPKGFACTEMMLMIAAAGIALIAAVGCGASQRETTIRAALVTVDSARDGFLAYDRSHEMSLVAHCDPITETRDACAAKVAASGAALAAYQGKRAKVDPVFTGAYHAIASAWLLNTDQSVASMQAALAEAITAVKSFMGSK